MALVYNEKYSRYHNPVLKFYKNRILRILPLYWLVAVLIVLLSIVFGLWLGSFGKLQFYIDKLGASPQTLSSLIFIALSNVSLIGQDWITFLDFSDAGNLIFMGLNSHPKLQEFLLIPIAWTVSVEVFFYAVTPWLAKKSIRVILVLILSVAGFRFILYIIFNVDGSWAIFRFAPTELFWFLLGVLSYKAQGYSNKILSRYAMLLWISLLSLIFTYPIHQLSWLIFFSIFLLTPTTFILFQKNSIDRYLGELTYPLYLGHMLIILIVNANRFPKPLGSGFPLLILTLIFSIIVYEFFIKRLEKIRVIQ